jgi:hypothetical protein
MTDVMESHCMELKLILRSEQLVSQDSHHVNKGPALVSILSRSSPVHIPKSYCSKMIFNIILPYTPWSSLWFI